MTTNKYVWMDITINGEKQGRIEFELYEKTPKTSYNFYCLCTGEKGIGFSRTNLHYKGNKFHRIVPGFFI